MRHHQHGIPKGIWRGAFVGLLGPTLIALTFCLAVSQPVGAEVSNQQAWEQEYAELRGQIARLKQANPARRQRLEIESLDRQALVWPDDRDPLDVVLRRTAALIRY